jgi:DNA-binding YbaB/EbfC family protein
MQLDSLMQGLKPVQDAMQKQEAERAGTTFEGSAGGGAVKVRIGGDLAVRGVVIAPAAATASAGDVGMLEDLVASALADALRQYRGKYGATANEQMQRLFSGSDLGALMGPMMGMMAGKR